MLCYASVEPVQLAACHAAGVQNQKRLSAYTQDVDYNQHHALQTETNSALVGHVRARPGQQQTCHDSSHSVHLRLAN